MITIDKRQFVQLSKKTPDHLAFPEPKSGKHVLPRNDIRQKNRSGFPGLVDDSPHAIPFFKGKGFAVLYPPCPLSTR